MRPMTIDKILNSVDAYRPEPRRRARELDALGKASP